MAYDIKSKNIIVLEDSKSRFVLEGMIKRLGFVPHLGTSREEFIEIYRNIPYFAIILDNQTPYDRDGPIMHDIGLNLAPQLLKKEPGLKVALHTSDDMSSRLREFQEIGLVYIEKPISMDDLRRFLIG